MGKKNNKCKVLIVEDDADISVLLGLRLENYGYEVFHSYDGEDAIRQIDKLKPSLVFLDLMLPKTNGFEVCHRIKTAEETRETKVIIISAKSYSADINKAKKLGADEYIVKPFNNDDVSRVLKSLEVEL